MNLVLSLAFSSSHKSFFTEIQIEERPLARGVGTEAELLRVLESSDTKLSDLIFNKVQLLVIY